MSPARTPPRRAPRPPAVDLPDLVAFAGGQLEAGDVHDGVSFHALDAAGAALAGLRLLECRLVDVVLDGAALAGARLADVVAERLSAVGADATRSTWRDVELRGARLSALSLAAARLERVGCVGARLDGVNLREAVLTDVVFEDCRMTEADLAGARLSRVSFDGCDLDRAQWSGAQLEAVDLRGARLGTPNGITGLAGAVISPLQLIDLAPALAAHAGLVVEG